MKKHSKTINTLALTFFFLLTLIVNFKGIKSNNLHSDLSLNNLLGVENVLAEEGTPSGWTWYYKEVSGTHATKCSNGYTYSCSYKGLQFDHSSTGGKKTSDTGPDYVKHEVFCCPGL